MEAIVLAGLIGAGYLMNDTTKKKNPITKPLETDITMPNGDNIYNSDIYVMTDNQVHDLAKKNFDASQVRDSGVINYQKLDPSALQETSFEEGMGNGVYSNASGRVVEGFLTNDQGIDQQPYFRGSAPIIENFDTSIFLNASQGFGNEFDQGKTETTPFFGMTPDLTNVLGNTFGSYIGDPSRYNNGNYQTNNLPFEQELVAPIHQNDNINREVDLAIANRRSIDNTRTLDNPKLINEGRILRGKEGENREQESLVYKHQPETYYENTQNRWLKTTGAITGDSQRPHQILPETNRMSTNTNELGIAGPEVGRSENRPGVKRSSKNQLGSDTSRNVGVETALSGTDFHQKGYRALPNERDLTTGRNHQTNISTEVNSMMVGVQDDIKQTVKETTIDSKNNGYMSNTFLHNTVGIQDSIPVTKKQTTINTKHNGNLKGDYEKRTSMVETPGKTTKDTLLFSHFGGGGADIQGDMDKTNYENSTSRSLKEIIAQGRAPTQNNVKLSNGMDQINIDIQKLEIDYMNHRLNGVDKVYQKTENYVPCELTTTKDRLNDKSISDRLNPELLDPFRGNPYTQSLESFSY